MVFHLATFAVTWRGQIEVTHISEGRNLFSRERYDISLRNNILYCVICLMCNDLNIQN